MGSVGSVASVAPMASVDSVDSVDTKMQDICPLFQDSSLQQSLLFVFKLYKFADSHPPYGMCGWAQHTGAQKERGGDSGEGGGIKCDQREIIQRCT